MAELSLNEPAGVLVKTTCVDYPGMLAGSFFLMGCNLFCPYCYNTDLVYCKKTSGINTIGELFSHLEKRQGILKGLVISGGEPLLNPYTPLIIKKARELGYKIKLDTNGTLCDELESILSDEQLKPDFIAMDIKTSPSKYASLIARKKSKYAENPEYFENALKRSSELISELPPDCREYRTVLVPPLVTKNDIKDMACILPEDASWQFAQFQNGSCLDPSYNELTPYTDDEVNELISYAKSLRKGAQLR
ncbi:MAG: anaerobic ribonucleoside-triphosphate reductase activating protein [Treponema sp.]|nr:anaerobic ribonucleoside-triphosphate reductase activating protein [Treponema sp.]